MNLPTEQTALAQALRELTRADQEYRQAELVRRSRVRHAARHGASAADVGRALGITRQSARTLIARCVGQ